MILNFYYDDDDRETDIDVMGVPAPDNDEESEDW